jgi:outer membrane protein OmpA-like peptidoglycan-associated protein
VRASFGPALDALPARPASFTLYFVTGTDELTAQSKAELQNILAAIMQRPVPDVVAIGHTDTVGELTNNDRLSAQRAERVKTFLIEIGIAASRIQTAGRGERELLIPTADNVDEPRNRRVEINVR